MTPTGEKIRTARGLALRFEREYAADPDEIWEALADPARTARWLGELRPLGDGQRLLMGQEDQGEYADLKVLVCERPHRIELDWTFPGDPGSHVLVELTAVAPGRTGVVLHHTFPAVTDPAALGGYGCGWQYYVDALATHLAGTDLPQWDDYLPGMLAEWRARVPSGG
jgi:uncharacterized protein YndB with AHSA1/START domain